MKEITLKTFIYHFCKKLRADKKYCFILGSGASKPSGIPTGGELVQKWIAELTEMYDPKELDFWKTEECISMDDLSKDYSKIFDKRFELDVKEGFSFLEQIIEGKEPSCGYSILAQILETKPHNIVITTNFDSLTEDALFIYTKKKPLVIGHEALAHYLKPFGSRPIIVKIHRDLFLTPKNTSDETSELNENFIKNLTSIFQYYTPLVIGYGGNDGSLMGFLENLDEIEGGIFWFYRENDGGLNNRIKNLIEKFNGYAIPISDFDDLMIQIGDKFELERLDGKIIKIAELRAKNYREQIIKLTEEKTTSKETKDAVSNIVSRGTKNWWYYEILASKEKNLTKRNTLYQEGIKSLPKSAILFSNYANFLYKTRKENDRAEEFFKKAIKLEPNNIYAISSYTNFLIKIREDYDKAEVFYKKIIELEPDNVVNISCYANFLLDIRKEYDKAEKFYKKAFELAPNNAYTIGSYANFLLDIPKEYDKAEEFYKKAIELVPNDANTIGNYSKCLITKRELQKAKSLIQKAFKLNHDENDVLNLELWFYRYAIFFDEYKEAKNSIEVLLKKGIKSIGWHLEDILEVAKELKHPDYKYLCELSKRITSL